MQAILTTENLCKSFKTNESTTQQVLKNITISINPREFISVMGPSGSGKSTFLYSVSGMDSIDSGKLYFEGQDMTKLRERDLARLRLNKMGFVFQQINMLKNLGILDNILLPGYAAKGLDKSVINERALELLKKTGIDELKNRDITEVSGGQLQRAAICRALINNPEIIFADEPTGALNSRSAEEVLKVFNTINSNGTTILLVTHDVKVASQSDRVLFMMDGEIKAQKVLGKFQEKNKFQREKELGNWLFDMGF